MEAPCKTILLARYRREAMYHSHSTKRRYCAKMPCTRKRSERPSGPDLKIVTHGQHHTAHSRCPGFRVLPEVLVSTLLAPECFRKHSEALSRRQSASGSTLPTSECLEALGRTLLVPECFRKHSDALCRHQSDSRSTWKHSTAAVVLPEALGSTLQAQECSGSTRKHFAACFRKHPEALCCVLPKGNVEL